MAKLSTITALLDRFEYSPDYQRGFLFFLGGGDLYLDDGEDAEEVRRHLHELTLPTLEAPPEYGDEASDEREDADPDDVHHAEGQVRSPALSADFENPENSFLSSTEERIRALQLLWIGESLRDFEELTKPPVVVTEAEITVSEEDLIEEEKAFEWWERHGDPSDRHYALALGRSREEKAEAKRASERVPFKSHEEGSQKLKAVLESIGRNLDAYCLHPTDAIQFGQRFFHKKEGEGSAPNKHYPALIKSWLDPYAKAICDIARGKSADFSSDTEQAPTNINSEDH